MILLLTRGLLSFQPTYEELKRMRPLKITFAPIGFQPTYEELKPSNTLQFHLSSAGFQPTYEELKQYHGPENPLAHVGVSSLPMRN